MSEPKLQAPGAGLPLLHRLMLRYVVGPFVSTKATWPESKKTFEKIYSKIDQKIEGLSDADLSKKVLVKPIMGLEDSSRYWSLAMTLEHLVIVGEGIEKMIILLSRGQVPPEKVDVAKVKPLGEISPAEAVKRYREFYQGAPARLEKNVKDWNSKTTYLHPWFGQFNANQWAWILAGHSGIHLQQVRQILAGSSSR